MAAERIEHEVRLEMFRAGFGRARDLGSDEVIAEVAARCVLPSERLLAAAHAPSLQRIVSEAFAGGQQRDGVFGVPSFVCRGQLFWGHDRLARFAASLGGRGE